MIRSIVIISLLVGISCAAKKRASDLPGSFIGKFSDQTGLDGCSWIITVNNTLEDGVEKYEPINLHEFSLQPKEGMAIRFSFDHVDGSSVCMMGKLVKLSSLSEIKN